MVNCPAQRTPALDGHGTGHGLRGLADRLGARGGTFSAGPTGDDGWRVAARVPRRVTERVS